MHKLLHCPKRCDTRPKRVAELRIDPCYAYTIDKCINEEMLLNFLRPLRDFSYIHMFKNEMSFLKRSSTASTVVIL